MASQNSRNGYTLTDLCAVLCVAALLLGAVCPPILVRTHDSAGRVKCASNLRQIGYALALYANANDQRLPRTVFDLSAPNPVPTEYTAWDAPDPFAPGGPGPNDVTAALFLTWRTEDLTADVFICPNTMLDRWDLGGKDKTQVSNFPSRATLGYSYINPYPSQAAMKLGFKLDTSLSSDFALAADMNPGGSDVLSAKHDAPREEVRKANSRNHGRDGQNVLYADGHVDWSSTPFCGSPRDALPDEPRDNIFAAYGNGPEGLPPAVRAAVSDLSDSVLLPTVLDGPQPPGPVGGPSWEDWVAEQKRRNDRVLYLAFGTIGVVTAAWLAYQWVRRRRSIRPPPYSCTSENPLNLIPRPCR